MYVKYRFLEEYYKIMLFPKSTLRMPINILTKS